MVLYPQFSMNYCGLACAVHSLCECVGTHKHPSPPGRKCTVHQSSHCTVTQTQICFVIKIFIFSLKENDGNPIIYNLAENAITCHKIMSEKCKSWEKYYLWFSAISLFIARIVTYCQVELNCNMRETEVCSILQRINNTRKKKDWCELL